MIQAGRRLGWGGTVLGLALALLGQNKAATGPDRRFLESELALASRPISYMVINLRTKAIDLKARGLALKSWPVSTWKVWGKSIVVKAVALKKKTSLKTPKRTNITPAKVQGDEKDKAEVKTGIDLGVLEVTDMPARFTLDFGNGVVVSVRPKPTKFWPKVGSVLGSAWRFIHIPLKTVWGVFRKKNFTQIYLVVPTARDAQSLYWAFLDGHNTIIYR